MLSIVKHVVNLKYLPILVNSFLEQVIIFISLRDFRLVYKIFVR